LRKTTINFFTSVSPSIRMEQLGPHGTYFHEIWYMNIFLKKTTEKIQFSLKSDKNKVGLREDHYKFVIHTSLNSLRY
jgi:hypothetical protein